MNEVELIHRQLATERLHFTAAANACAQVIKTQGASGSGEFLQMCAEYFAFALARLNPATGISLGHEQTCSTRQEGSAAVEEAARKLTLARSDTSTMAGERWGEFLQWFANELHVRFAPFEDLKSRNLPVAEWRAMSRIDADSVFTERARYRRIEETLPPHISLSDSTAP
jgi:hypothetical protein